MGASSMEFLGDTVFQKTPWSFDSYNLPAPFIPDVLQVLSAGIVEQVCPQGVGNPRSVILSIMTVMNLHLLQRGLSCLFNVYDLQLLPLIFI